MAVLNKDTSNTLTLSQSATVEISIVADSGNTLSITDELTVNQLIKTLSQTVSLIQSATYTPIINAIAITNLQLSQPVLQSGLFVIDVSSSLNLTQNARSVIRVGIASNILNLTHLVTPGGPISVAVVSSLLGQSENIDPDELFNITDLSDTDDVSDLLNDEGLRQDIKLTTRLNLGVTSFLSLSQSAGPFIEGIVSNHISFTHSTRTVLSESASNTLFFTQVVIGHIVQDIFTTLNLTQIADSDLVTTEVITTSLTLKSVVSYYNVIDLCGYSPGIGEGTFDVVAPSATPPTLIRRSTTVLTYPFTSPTLTLSLRNPDFDNVEQFEFRRINRRSRGGTLDLFRDETWPKVKRLIYNFSGLKEQAVDDLLIFLNMSLGEEIGILDFESRQWKGIIITPSSPIQQPSKDRHGASFEFEGSLI